VFNELYGFALSHLTYGSGDMEIEEGAGAFGKGTKEIEGIRVYEMTPDHFHETMRALVLMAMYGGPEGMNAFFTITLNAVLWEYNSDATFGPGMTSKNWKDVAIDFDDLSPLKVGWEDKVGSVGGPYSFAKESGVTFSLPLF